MSPGIVTGEGATGCNAVDSAGLAAGAVEDADESLILCLYDNADCTADTPYNSTYIDYEPLSPNGGPSAETEVTLGLGTDTDPYRPFLAYRVQAPHQVADEQLCAGPDGAATTTAPPVSTSTASSACAGFDCSACGSPFDDPCCASACEALFMTAVL